jgi:hypothetical protein
MNPATPPPLPTRTAALVRALCGPLLLTSLGVLMALDHMGGMSFGRTWPVLVIVFGACKLAEHLGARQVGASQ